MITMNVDLGEYELEIEMDTVLYHYTSINSLYSIVENKEFWVTRSDYMNDTSEVIYFNEVIRKAVNNHLNRNDIKSNVWAEWKESVQEKYGKEQDRAGLSGSIFILSFSKNPDSLSMWNYYGKNDGYNFSILKSEVDDILKSKFRGHIVKCGSLIYDFDRQVEILEKELFKAYEFFLQNFSIEGVLERLHFELNQRVFHYSYFFKHSAFKNEEEYRFSFIYMANTDWFYRPYMGVIAPYIKIKDSDDNKLIPIITVMAGPLIKHERALNGLDMWLNSKGYRHNSKVKLIKSSVPIRF